MKILLLGKNGQVGWELNRSLMSLGEIVALDRAQADFSKPEELRKIVSQIKPNVIVNAVAYTAVDKAESEVELAEAINAIAPGVLAEEALKINALLVHYSTDYVFDGSKDGAYVETDKPCPINVYGRTKLAGEQAIQSSGCNYFIFRTSWVYAARGQNFMHSMLRLAKQREQLKIVDDQVGAPTWARLISDVSLHALVLAQREIKHSEFESGVFNLVATGQASWCQFANKIIDIARETLDNKDLIVESIDPIPTSEYPTPAKRPLNSRLGITKLEERFDCCLSDWEQSLKLCMLELK